MELITSPYFLLSGILAFVLTGLIYFCLTESENNTTSESELFQLKSKEGFEKVEKNAKQKNNDVLQHFDEVELTQKIYQLLIIEEIYLQPSLTVGEFAKKLGVQARIVTQILEKLYGHTFKELTNMYRIEYAKDRIEEGFLDSYTLNALAQEAGFSSRTTFFNVFKKEIGICPSEYWKKYLAQAA